MFINICYVYCVGLLLQGQMRIAKLKSTYTSLTICPTGLGW